MDFIPSFPIIRGSSQVFLLVSPVLNSDAVAQQKGSYVSGISSNNLLLFSVSSSLNSTLFSQTTQRRATQLSQSSQLADWSRSEVRFYVTVLRTCGRTAAVTLQAHTDGSV